MSTDESEEREVEEAEGRGESEGETAAEDSESFTAVVDGAVRLKMGLLGLEAPDDAETEAIATVNVNEEGSWLTTEDSPTELRRGGR